MKIPDSIPAEGFNIPLKAAYTGVKSVPLISLAHNSAFPKLLIFDDATQTRVILSRRRPLSEIESIELAKTFGTYHLTINWKNRFFSFTAAVGAVDTLLSVAEFFRRKNVALSDAARRFITESNKI